MAVIVCGKTGAGKSSVIEAITSEGAHCIPSTYIMYWPMVVNTDSKGPNHVKHGCTKGDSLSSKEVGSASSQGRYSTSTFVSEKMSFPHVPNPDFKADHDTSLLYLIDTGGLPEFYDILPLFLSGKSQLVILYVINLSEDLSDPDIDIMHLMHLMSPKDGTTTCRIAVIGTHKDLEHECMETRLQKNRKVREMLNDLSVQDDHMVAYHGRHELIFPLNAKHLGSEDLQTVSKLKHTVLTENIQALQTLQGSVTDTTYLLFLQLQMRMKALNRSVMRRSECFAVAQQLHFTESTFEIALKYLNEHNMLHYCHDDLPNVVLDQQVLVEKTAEIVRYCHRLRQISAPHAYSCLTSEGKLQRYGIVTRELLTGFNFDEIFPEADLLKLLVNRLLVAECSPNEYLMPCLMPLVEFSEPLSSRRAPSLLLSFQRGGPPAGLFCATICHLISYESWKLKRESNSSPTQLTRKRIQFISGDYIGAITLCEYPSFFEVNIDHGSDDLMLYSALCAKVRKDVLSAVRTALSILGYSESRRPQEAFYCTRNSCASSPHPAIIQSGSQWMKCICDCSAEVDKLTSQHRLWFGTMRGKIMCSVVDRK